MSLSLFSLGSMPGILAILGGMLTPVPERKLWMKLSYFGEGSLSGLAGSFSQFSQELRWFKAELQWGLVDAQAAPLGPQLRAYSIYGVQPPGQFLVSNFYLHNNIRLPKIPFCFPASFLGISAFHFMWLRFTKDFKGKTTKCQAPFSVPPFLSGTFASGILADVGAPRSRFYFLTPIRLLGVVMLPWTSQPLSQRQELRDAKTRKAAFRNRGPLQWASLPSGVLPRTIKEILVPRPGIEPVQLAVEAQSPKLDCRGIPLSGVLILQLRLL